MSKTIDDILDSLYAAGSTHGGNGVSYDKSDNPRLAEAKAELESLLLGDDAPQDKSFNCPKGWACDNESCCNGESLETDSANKANTAWRQHIRNKLGSGGKDGE